MGKLRIFLAILIYCQTVGAEFSAGVEPSVVSSQGKLPTKEQNQHAAFACMAQKILANSDAKVCAEKANIPNDIASPEEDRLKKLPRKELQAYVYGYCSIVFDRCKDEVVPGQSDFNCHSLARKCLHGS